MALKPSNVDRISALLATVHCQVLGTKALATNIHTNSERSCARYYYILDYGAFIAAVLTPDASETGTDTIHQLARWTIKALSQDT